MAGHFANRRTKMGETAGEHGQEVRRVLDDPNLSAVDKYALLTVGTRARSALLKHEFLTGLLSGWPGAVGLFLRQKAYRGLFQSMGRGVVIGRHVTLRGAAQITIGDRVFIDDYCVLDARGEQASITLGDGTLLARNTVVRTRGEAITIGPGTNVGTNCILSTDSRLEIGADVLVAAYVYLCAGGAHRYDDRDTPILKQGFTSKGGIVVGEGAWLGARTTVLDGVTVGRGTIVGAQSLVNRSLPDMAIAHGIPAQVAGQR
jgi:acetyltransferase-like isoleucine patch superfamily enzyme